MRIIFTQEDKKQARRNIDKFRQSYVIDAKEMIYEYDYRPDSKISTPNDYIIQQEIEKKLKQAINNKKSKQVIYFHYRINKYMIDNIKNFFKENGGNFLFALYDPNATLINIHNNFDEILS